MFASLVSKGTADRVLQTTAGTVVKRIKDREATRPIRMATLRDRHVHQHNAYTDPSGSTTFMNAGGVGVYINLTQLIITNGTADTGVRIDVGNQYSLYVKADETVSIVFETPLAQDTANSNWVLSPFGDISSLYVTAIGYRETLSSE